VAAHGVWDADVLIMTAATLSANAQDVHYRRSWRTAHRSRRQSAPLPARRRSARVRRRATRIGSALGRCYAPNLLVDADGVGEDVWVDANEHGVAALAALSGGAGGFRSSRTCARVVSSSSLLSMLSAMLERPNLPHHRRVCGGFKSVDARAVNAVRLDDVDADADTSSLISFCLCP
jgi:hypothetical protein